jgi:hypothetical protein
MKFPQDLTQKLCLPDEMETSASASILEERANDSQRCVPIRSGQYRSMIASCLLVGFAAMALLGGTQPASAAENFSVVSPDTAAHLHDFAGTPAALATIQAARGRLASPPGPVERVHTEGTIVHQGIWDLSIKAEKDWSTMLDFALAYRFTNDPAFLQAAQTYLSAWMDVYHPSYNPIDETGFDRVLVTCDLSRSDLPPDFQAKMEAYLALMARGYVGEAERNEKDTANWESHRIKLATLTAFASGDAGLIERAHEAYLQHLSVNIRPDGAIEDFFKRDALHYVTYDLEPLLAAAIAARAHGQDWYDVPAGHPLLPAALDWLAPYALGEKTHDEFVHSKVKFDAQRAQAGMHGYSGPWEPVTARATYLEAAQLDPRFERVRNHVLGLTKAEAPPWSALPGLAVF